MKQISLGFLPLALGIWNCVFADVPHTFQSGTPALASEVNDNFNSLDARLSSIEKYTADVDINEFITPFSAVGDPKNGYVRVSPTHKSINTAVCNVSQGLWWHSQCT